MKKILLLILLCLTVGCSDKKEIEIGVDGVTFFSDYSSAPFVDVPRASLPGWLASWISAFDDVSEFITRIYIFWGKWEEQNLYFFFHGMDLPSITVYGEDGTRMSTDDVENRLPTESKNWVLIFKIDNFFSGYQIKKL